MHINYAQNLVPNPYFEIYSPCPNNAGQINYATGWQSASSSPDYFNACGPFGVSVPYGVGYQNDNWGGGGFSGAFVFDKAFPNSREYIQIKLNDTLMAGKKYLASMYVNLTSYSNYAISTMGMYFTDTAVYATGGNFFINVPNPQVKNTTPLTDTLNWMLVQDTVLAIGTELYLTIGNFSTDITSDTLKVFNNMADAAYYYIDGVSVIDVAALSINDGYSKNSGIEMFPTPGRGEVYFKCAEGLTGQFLAELYSMTGELVLKKQVAINNGAGGLNLEVENGVYMLYLFDEKGQKAGIYKLVISK